MKFFVASVVASLLLVASTQALVTPKPPDVPWNDGCGNIHGTFTIDQYQLYPESVDFDPRTCTLYLSNAYNNSISIYSPYTEKIESLQFPDITGSHAYEMNGVSFDRRTGYLGIVLVSKAAYYTVPPQYANTTGSTLALLYDVVAKELLYTANLTEVTQGRYGAFTDIDFDPLGRAYVVGTVPASILRIDAYVPGQGTPKITEWYNSEAGLNTWGFGGIAANGWFLIANDVNANKLLKFDAREEKGVPCSIPISPPHTLFGVDACYFPKRYNQTILLNSEDEHGVAVYRSQDRQWDAAEYLGQIPVNNSAVGRSANGLVTATVQIGGILDGSIYANLEYFFDPNAPGESTGDGFPYGGNRTMYLYFDITEEVEALVNA